MQYLLGVRAFGRLSCRIERRAPRTGFTTYRIKIPVKHTLVHVGSRGLETQKTIVCLRLETTEDVALGLSFNRPMKLRVDLGELEVNF